MFRALFVSAVLMAATFSTSCGTSSAASKEQTRTGVTETGYPGGQPKDAESPALASSSEQAHSNPIPKVPEGDEPHGAKHAAPAASHAAPAAAHEAPAAAHAPEHK